MELKITKNMVRKEPTEKTRAIEKQVIEQRPSEDSLSWEIEIPELQ